MRHPELIYPPNRQRSGVDYSYGIGMPLSAGGWAVGGAARGAEPRRFVGHETHRSTRLLAADANESFVFNLSGDAVQSMIWNDPTQFDNTMSWRRHASSSGVQFATNVLYQDGHASAAMYDLTAAEPVNTTQTHVWQSGEPISLSPDDQIGGYAYPNASPSNFPDELAPAWYTTHNAWTLIGHK
jgi:prepilin-type processing-associated H-X9-DG protein